MPGPILTTNPQPQNDRLAALLRARGAEVVQLPLHRVEPTIDGSERLAAALQTAEQYRWILLASRPAAETFIAAWRAAERSWPAATQLAAMGEATAQVLRDAGFAVALVGTGGGAELAHAVVAQGVGERVLSLQAEAGRDDWHKTLVAAGADLDVIPTHRLAPVALDANDWCRSMADQPISAVLFTAPSAVYHFCVLFSAHRTVPPFATTRYYPIGTTTATALREHDFAVAGMPPRPSFELLANVVISEAGKTI